MPYCPKCDMEFVEGITVCSDCGGPLYASEEAAEEAKKAELAARNPRPAAEYSKLAAEHLELTAEHLELADEYSRLAGEHPELEAKFSKLMAEHPELAAEYPELAAGYPEAAPDIEQDARKEKQPPVKSYVKKSEKYEDRKSSASAFFLIGGVLTVFSILCWTNIFPMPMDGPSKYLIQGTFTVMGIGCLVIAFQTLRSAKAMAAGIEDEEKETEALVRWFLDTHRKDDLERQLDADFTDMTEDEKNLKRFELIQDLLITSHDLPDQAYVDALCEEIYEKLYEEV